MELIVAYYTGMCLEELRKTEVILYEKTMSWPKYTLAPHECKFRFRFYTITNLDLPEHVKGNETRFCISLGSASLPVRVRST